MMRRVSGVPQSRLGAVLAGAVCRGRLGAACSTYGPIPEGYSCTDISGDALLTPANPVPMRYDVTINSQGQSVMAPSDAYTAGLDLSPWVGGGGGGYGAGGAARLAAPSSSSLTPLILGLGVVSLLALLKSGRA